MNQRQVAIAKAILKAFHDLDGGQAHQISIHGDANLILRAVIPRNEFDEVFDLLNVEGCFIGVKDKYKGLLWSLTSNGEKTRQEMR